MLSKVKEQIVKHDFKIKKLSISELVDVWIRLGWTADIEEGYSPVQAVLDNRDDDYDLLEKISRGHQYD
jgi:hypothetical protein